MLIPSRLPATPNSTIGTNIADRVASIIGAEPSAGRRQALHGGEVDPRKIGRRRDDAALSRATGVEAEPLADVGGQFGGAFGEDVVVGDRGRDHVATQPDLDVGPGVLRVAGVDDLLDVAQHRAQPALQVVLDIGDQVLHTVGEHLLPGGGGEIRPAVRSCAEASCGDHLLGLRRFGRARISRPGSAARSARRRSRRPGRRRPRPARSRPAITPRARKSTRPAYPDSADSVGSRRGTEPQERRHRNHRQVETGARAGAPR